jgi:hypothetical protein
MDAVTVVALSFVVIVCVAAVFYVHYPDTWLQFAAFVLISIGGLATIGAVIDEKSHPELLLMSVGLAIYFLDRTIAFIKSRKKSTTHD